MTILSDLVGIRCYSINDLSLYFVLYFVSHSGLASFLLWVVEVIRMNCVSSGGLRYWGGGGFVPAAGEAGAPRVACR
jgi:hypothetical protein